MWCDVKAPDSEPIFHVCYQYILYKIAQSLSISVAVTSPKLLHSIPSSLLSPQLLEQRPASSRHLLNVATRQAVPQPTLEKSSILDHLLDLLVSQQRRRVRDILPRRPAPGSKAVLLHIVDPVQVRLIHQRGCDDQATRLEEERVGWYGIDRSACARQC